jgi:periplasmic protein TonB
MFEDSTFESTGRIKTRSRQWMIATLAVNGSILLALILIPLVFPDALPRQSIPFLVQAPTTPPAETSLPQIRQRPQVSRGSTVTLDRSFYAPTKIPQGLAKNDRADNAPGSDLRGMDIVPGLPDGGTGVFVSRNVVPVVHADVKGPVRVSSMVVSGLILQKTPPIYPAIAKATGTHGTVVLQAMISKSGTIENLHVVSGPVMLQQAAVDAVKTWRYRPYLLNHEPVEVETTVNVVFTIAN